MAKNRENKDGDSIGSSGLSRRDFLTTAGIGTLGIAAAGSSAAVEAGPGAKVVAPAELVRIALRVNGRTYRLLVEPRWSLLHVLREHLGLGGAKASCERGECGACTVLVDDQSRYACMTLAVEAERTEITTVEGLLDGEELGEVQQAFVEHDAFQCGYCTPGQVMAVEGLLRTNAEPELDEIRRGLSGNLCRCGAYPNIFRAARRAGELKRAQGGAS
ncbi:MAG: (2Fe-2S)-binding protein [bacterium]|nr:(2Fe-2S)-binding protein [bacterium]